MFGLEGIAHDHRDIARDHRHQRHRVQHLGAEIGELGCLGIRQRIERYRLGHEARVGRGDAIDIGPDMQLARFEQRRKQGAGIIAAVAAKGGGAALTVASNVAGRQHMPGVVRAAPLRQPGAAVLPVDDAAHGALGTRIAHREHLARIEQIGIDAGIGEVGLQQLRGKHLAQPLDRVKHFGDRNAEHRQRVELCAQADESRIQRIAHCVASAHIAHPGGRFQMALAQRLPGIGPGAITATRTHRQLDQGIGTALERRHHNH